MLPRFITILFFLAFAPCILACDSDADCDGGTCIKREKRASGVCYGRAPETIEVPAELAPAQPGIVQGERRERAKAWLGDPDLMIEQHLPGKETSGVCMLTTDCAVGFQCVIAGFEGRCVKF